MQKEAAENRATTKSQRHNSSDTEIDWFLAIDVFLA